MASFKSELAMRRIFLPVKKYCPFFVFLVKVTFFCHFLQIYNASGNLMVKKQLEAGTQQINISALSKGIYFIKAGNASIRVVIK